jgi:hypothetical protein
LSVVMLSTNRTKGFNRALALCLWAEILAQQLEELKQLRDRVRRAEAKAICATPHQPSFLRRKRMRSGSLRRHCHRIR